MVFVVGADVKTWVWVKLLVGRYVLLLWQGEALGSGAAAADKNISFQTSLPDLGLCRGG